MLSKNKRRVATVCVAIVFTVISMLVQEAGDLKTFLHASNRGFGPIDSVSYSSSVESMMILETNVSEPSSPTNHHQNQIPNARSDSTSNQQVNTTITTLNDRSSHGYLQYFVSGGWGNQIRCLSSAYQIAWATNRTLVLSPLVPHFYMYYRNIFDAERYQFRLDYDLQKTYLSLISIPNNTRSKNEPMVGAGVEQRHKYYIPLGRVLDIEFTLPLVPTVDFRDFYQNVHPTLPRKDVWVMESNFTHFNTRWTVDQPALEGLTETIHQPQENGRILDQDFNLTIRDLPSVGRAMAHVPIWTLLDSFRAIPMTRGTGVVTSKIRPHTAVVRVPRFSSWIRQMTYRILLDYYEWDMDTMPYASMHIRGSDGPFNNRDALSQVIQQGMDAISMTVQNWTDSQSNSNARHGTVGLFVASDLQDLSGRGIFSIRVLNLREALQTRYNTTLRLLQSHDIQQALEQIYQNDSQSFAFPDIETAGVFFDQQVAACAPIGFRAMPRSTYSQFISSLRKDRVKACELD